jgi:hypothetical protein
MRGKKFIIFCLLFFLSFIAEAQQAKKPFSLLAGFFAANDGINLMTEAQFEYAKNVIHAGPAIDIFRTTSVKIRGWKGGYKRIVIQQEPLCSFAGLEFQFNKLTPVIEPLYTVTKNNYHYEINISYGLEWNFLGKAFLGSSIGVGGFKETYHSADGVTTYTVSGYSRYLDLYIRYRL